VFPEIAGESVGTGLSEGSRLTGPPEETGEMGYAVGFSDAVLSLTEKEASRDREVS